MSEARPRAIEPATARLRLRQWRDEDYPPFAALNADPRVMEHFPAPLDRAQSDALADRVRAQIDGEGWGLWAVEVTAGPSFIGFVGLAHAGPDLPPAPCVEVGWRLAAEHWGQGYATEAARAALQVAFSTLRLPEVVSFTAVTNTRSQRVMQRIGLRHDGERFMHPRIPDGHPLQPHVVYRLRSEAWMAER